MAARGQHDAASLAVADEEQPRQAQPSVVEAAPRPARRGRRIEGEAAQQARTQRASIAARGIVVPQQAQRGVADRLGAAEGGRIDARGLADADKHEIAVGTLVADAHLGGVGPGQQDARIEVAGQINHGEATAVRGRGGGRELPRPRVGAARLLPFGRRPAAFGHVLLHSPAGPFVQYMSTALGENVHNSYAPRLGRRSVRGGTA